MSKERAVPQKEPIAMLWIIIGLLISVAAMIGIERLVERY
jgi:hypothetical protein